MRGMLFGFVLLAAACGAHRTGAVDPAAMDHTSASDAHTQHGSAAVADPHAHHGQSPPIAIAAPRSNSEIRAIQPSATLQPDAFDAPAPVSAGEAAKARGGGHEEHTMGHGTPTTATVYVCPMHPEVTSDKPGDTCPKCGMALVKKD